jgi:purine-nucleoside phosphorylase
MDDDSISTSGDPAWSASAAYELADMAAARIAGLTGVAHHDVAVVLGTGLADAAAALGEERSRHPLAELPGLPQSFVAHQRSEFWSVDVGGVRVLTFLGRLHLYEGYGPGQVAHPVRTAIAAGCHSVVLTNASGSLRPEVGPGSVVVIADHLNLTGRSPMEGLPAPPDRPSPFTELVDAWSPRLRKLVRSVDPSVAEGVYAQVAGPQFETPAEIRMLRTLGADLVGMSSVLEATAARQAGAEVLGLSVVTNLAAGMEPTGVPPEEIIEVGRLAAPQVGRLIGGVLRTM